MLGEAEYTRACWKFRGKGAHPALLASSPVGRYWRRGARTVAPACTNSDVVSRTGRPGEGAVALRPGVLELIETHAAAGPAGHCTTTSPVNVAALLRKALGENLVRRFAVVEDASTAPNKSPHPRSTSKHSPRPGALCQHAWRFEDSPTACRRRARQDCQ